MGLLMSVTVTNEVNPTLDYYHYVIIKMSVTVTNEVNPTEIR